MNVAKDQAETKMRNLRTLVVMLSILYGGDALAQSATHNARAFTCGFISDKTKTGKSGRSSCSFTAEKVFSTASNPFPAREHCKTESVFDYEDLRLKIDLETNKVIYEREEGLAPFAITQMIEYYMRNEKIGREAAEQKVKSHRMAGLPSVEYRIFYVHKGAETYLQDPVTQTFLKEPKSVPIYTISFGYNFGSSLYSIFVPENGNAILSRYWSNEDSSWVSLRFGKCRAAVAP